MTKKIIILLILVITLLSCSTVSAATYNVNDQMPNDFIQMYMGFLNTGDTLNFNDGTIPKHELICKQRN
jgi:PBP1b-binding outer membrane lipoprotein LpoB